MATTPNPASGVPVSSARIENCLRSAGFWVNELPRYADRQQIKADFWAITAGILAAVTSLAIFPVLGNTPTTEQKFIVSAAALLSAICALVPRVKNYGEMAGQARELSSRYGGIVGDLVDLSHAPAIDPERASAIVDEFESIKSKKDGLRGLPDRESVEIRRMEMARKVSEARTKTAEAARAEAEAERAVDLAKHTAGGPAPTE
jgi:hypothetical protein